MYVRTFYLYTDNISSLAASKASSLESNKMVCFYSKSKMHWNWKDGAIFWKMIKSSERKIIPTFKGYK